MLQQLHIRHLLLIKDCRIDWHDQLNVLSGESGSGKSLILQAMALVNGARFDSDLLAAGQKNGSVTATWCFATDHPVWMLLADWGIEVDPDGMLVIRRQFGSNAGIFVNDALVVQKSLLQLAPHITEVYGQFAAHRLAEADYQRHIVDDFAGLLPLVKQVEQCYRAWQQAQSALSEAEEKQQTLAERADYVAYVLSELQQENIAEDELELLQQQRLTARQQAQSFAVVQSALELLQKSSVSRGLEQVQSALIEAESEDFEPIVEGLERASIEIAEAERSLQQCVFDLDSPEFDLNSIEERLFRLSELGRKHQVAPENLLQVQYDLEQEALAVEQGADALLRLRDEAEAASALLHEQCRFLSTQRREAASTFAAAVNQELPNLNMLHAEVTLRVMMLDQPTAAGAERIQLLLRTQPDAEARPLLKVASGGELSRVLLAIALGMGQGKSTSAADMTLVLDEVDAGMGGETAAILGSRLKFLSTRRQIIAVTHSPQVASCADHHLRVHKTVQDNTAVSQAYALDADTRREEIARMLAGEVITDAARSAADALLTQSA